MTDLFDPVQSGDLITATRMNLILSKLQNLDERVAALEGSSSGNSDVDITSIVPSGTLTVDQVIQVLGRNFDYTLRAQRVFFDQTPVTEFENTSNDTTLVLRVPVISDLPEVGKPMLLIVNNIRTGSSDTFPVYVQPQSVEGDVILDFISVTPTTPQPNQPITFRFRAESQANRKAMFTITPTSSVPAHNTQFQVLDASSGITLTGRSIEIVPGLQNRKEFLIFLPSLTGVSLNSSFTISVSIGAGAVLSTVTPPAFTAGQAYENPDTSISLGVNFDDPDTILNEATNTISLALNQIGTLGLDAGFTIEGTYNIFIETTPATTNWQVVLLEPVVQPPATVPFYVITASEIASGNAARGPRFRVRPNAGASATGKTTVVIQRQGQTLRKTLSFNLALT